MDSAAGKQQPINKLRTASDLNNKLDSLKRGRRPQESVWKLALAFYKGKQYTYYNRTTRRLESLPVEDGEKPRYRVRIVSNQIMPGSHSLLSKYTKTKPVISASAASGSDEDLKAAQVADKLLQHWWGELSLDDKLAEALLWSIIAGNGYWKITWDPYANKAQRFLLDPQGKPILDEALKTLFTAQLQQMGVQAQEKVVYMGEIDVSVPSPFDVYLDDSAKVWDDVKYAICDHYMTPEEIKAKWDAEVKADATADSPDALLPYGSSKSAESTVKAVHVGYFRKTPAQPNGRYVVWVDEKILEDMEWPYPFDELPLIKFPGARIPGAIYDGSIVEQAIPLQKDLNRTLSQIVEYKNLTLKPRVWAPTGSLNGVRLTSEPGAVYEFNPIGDHKPEIEKLPSLPPYVFEHLVNIKTTLKEIFGVNEISEGTPPPNVEAGIAIDLLQEMATDRLAPTILLIEKVLGRGGELMLKLAQQYYQEPRTLKIQGSGATAQVRKFTQADLKGGVNIVVETGSALPRTRAGRQQRILDYLDRGVITPQQAYKYLDVGDLEGLGARFKADDDQAYREHERLLEHQPLNTYALNQAMQQLQSGQATNPDGSPISDPNQFLRVASLQPFPFENYQTHMDIHGLFLKSPEYEALPPDVQKDFVDHYIQTLQTFIKLPQPVQYKPVAPSLQIKGTVGPTVAAEILGRAGLPDVTPQQLMEPPLETWVSDKVDEPNLSESAQAHVTARDIQLKELELAQKGVSGHHEHTRNQMDAITQHQMDAHNVRRAAAEADLAEKKARQSNFRPRPKPRGGK